MKKAEGWRQWRKTGFHSVGFGVSVGVNYSVSINQRVIRDEDEEDDTHPDDEAIPVVNTAAL